MCRRRPDLLPEVQAWDPATGCLLLRDAGTQLAALDEAEQLARWSEAFPLYAELQRDVAPDAAELTSLIPLDRRLASLTARYEELLADTELLRVGRPGGLTEDEHRRARELADEVARGCNELASYAVPETIQNDDLSAGSVFVTPDGYRFLDWSDACVSHPFFSLTVTLRVIEHGHGLPPGSPEADRLRDAYLEPWTSCEPRATLIELAATARRLGQACRAVFYRYLSLAIALEERDREDVPWSLRLFLEPESWRA
jgi:Phosphotransferase enzyme family